MALLIFGEETSEESRKDSSSVSATTQSILKSE